MSGGRVQKKKKIRYMVSLRQGHPDPGPHTVEEEKGRTYEVGGLFEPFPNSSERGRGIRVCKKFVSLYVSSVSGVYDLNVGLFIQWTVTEQRFTSSAKIAAFVTDPTASAVEKEG